MDEKEKLKASLDQIHAEESLKTSTKKYLFEKVYFKEKKRFSPLRKFAAAAVCSLAVFIGGGSWLFFTPTAFISVDVNPSLELEINRFDRVLSVEGYNDDGKSLAESLHIRFMSYETAVRQILEMKEISVLLSQNEALTIAVSGSDRDQCGRILSDMEACTRGHGNAHCYHVDSAELEEAHEMGLSLGKYNAFLRLRELDPDITPEEVQNMTMREILDRIETLSPGGWEKGHGGHHGKGHASEKPQ